MAPSPALSALLGLVEAGAKGGKHVRSVACIFIDELVHTDPARVVGCRDYERLVRVMGKVACAPLPLARTHARYCLLELAGEAGREELERAATRLLSDQEMMTVTKVLNKGMVTPRPPITSHFTASSQRKSLSGSVAMASPRAGGRMTIGKRQGRLTANGRTATVPSGSPPC